MALAVFAGIVVLGAAGYFIIRKKIRSFSREFLGTEDIVEGFRRIEAEAEITPKSVNAMTSLYLPKIRRDFPEFNYEEMKGRAQNLLRSFLLAVDGKSEGRLSEGNAELKEKLAQRLDILRGAGEAEHFKDMKIHRTEISDYRKAAGRCIITFQSSVQYYYTRTKEDGTVLKGSDSALTQTRYEEDLIYIQDRGQVEGEHDGALGANCPNCGAPLSGLGAKVCEYCGTALREINIYAWSFSDVREI